MGRIACFIAISMLFVACDKRGPEPINGPCDGDPGIHVFASFASTELEAQTKILNVVARERNANGDGCADIWEPPSELAQNSRQVTLESARGGVLHPLSLEQFPALDVFVYAHSEGEPNIEPTTAAIGGGCAVFAHVGDEHTQCMVVEVNPAP